MDYINVCLACDDNYAKYAAVVIASILENAKSTDKLVFYILDGGIESENKDKISSLKNLKECEINFIQIDNSQFEDYLAVKTHSYISIPTYYRLKLPTLLPNVSRVIYLDCDVVVNSSLEELFNTDMGSSPVAGVRDLNRRMLKKNPSYVNAGMLVMDLDNMKQQDVEHKFLKWTREHFETIKTGDQEIINEVLKGQIKIVDDEWNVQSSNFTNRSSYTRNPKIIHFVARKKPWHYASFSYHRDYYFKYLQLTPWALSDEDLEHWTKDNQIASLIEYVKYRPCFLLRRRFFEAFYKTYMDDFIERLFSIKPYGETHNLIKIFGIKIKVPNKDIAKKRKENPYYFYKKNNIDITTVPVADGQLRDLQLANLALLKELDYVCKKHSIRYWIDFGSLLGAVRHKGFIPWDDDIDVGMLRNDYETFIEIFNSTVENKDIYVSQVRSEKNPCQYYLKVQHKKSNHLFVDIFPYDFYNCKMTNDEQLQETLKIKQIRKDLQKVCSSATSDDDVKILIDKQREKFVDVNGEAKQNDLVWGIDFNHNWKNWFTSYETAFPLKTISFEGIEFPCMNDIDAYLKSVYGNYMAYPKKIGVGHSMFSKLTETEKEVIQELVKGVLN